jgi:NAD(P)-dependent dehydrogenase (short-subunit alcohol dehydrogenase family)
MPQRAAIVTGASQGIGLALAHMLGQEGYALTVNSRRPEKIEAAAEELRAAGYEVESVPGSVADEAVVQEVVRRHRERYGRLDVLVNNAGIGIGEPIDQVSAKTLDIQIGANFRQIALFYREAVDLLRAAGAEHRNAQVFNSASITGKHGEAWVSIYSATKAAVIGFTQSMNRELNRDGIKSCALCAAFVDTPMTEFLGERVTADQKITTGDIAEMVRATLKTSPGCTIPELVFEQTDFKIAEVGL